MSSIAGLPGLNFTPIKGIVGLNAALADAARQGRPAMLDFYADWCVSCKELEAYTFVDADVQAALSNAVLLRADVTANDEDDRELQRSLGTRGPPAILFYDRSGQELKQHRLFGFKPGAEFAGHVRQS